MASTVAGTAAKQAATVSKCATSCKSSGLFSVRAFFFSFCPWAALAHPFVCAAQYLGYSLFAGGVVYGIIKRQTVANKHAGLRASKIAELEKTIAAKDAEIAKLRGHKD